jgi:hypothetical protein
VKTLAKVDNLGISWEKGENFGKSSRRCENFGISWQKLITWA